MRFFVDTSAWSAFYDASDQWHSVASEVVASLVNTPVTFVTTDYVLDETITLLLYHAGRRHAIAFGDATQRSRQVKIVRIDAALWSEAWQLFKQYDDKSWAFTDCTSFVVMKRMGLSQAFAFDNHFEQAGFQLWPAVDR